jgi:hypothetical protein
MTRRRPPSLADCHALGHAWFPIDTRSDYKPLFGTPLWVECERCGTQRHDLIDATGAVGSRSYEYPDGYRYAKGTRPTRAAERLALLDRYR